MKITKIELSDPVYMRAGRDSRCHFKVKSGPSSRPNCFRFATYKIDDAMYCNQHAGKVALDHLINGNKKDRRYLNIEGMK